MYRHKRSVICLTTDEAKRLRYVKVVILLYRFIECGFVCH